MSHDLCWRLSPNVRLAALGDDIVLMDLGRDAYECWPGAADMITPLPQQGVRLTAPAVHSLFQDEGWIETDAEADRDSMVEPPEPGRDLAGAPAARPTIVDGVRMALQALQGWRAGPATPLATLMADVRAFRGSVPLEPAPDHRRCALVFAALRPWSPRQGLCLYRSYALLRFLAANDLAAHWVFGVRTWPFSAHCWVQVGDLVLDDDLDRVRSYVRIAVI